MTKTNDFGQPILFETPNNGNGYFEFAQFYGGYDRPYALRGISPSGDFAYLGLFEQAEIRGLAKAILNAMEPDALVENKPAEPTYKPGDWVKVADDSPYNDNFRGQTLRLHENQSGYPERGDGLRITGAHDVPALVASVADLEERVTALESKPEPEPTLWGYKVGDLVKYTRMSLGLTGTVRKVVAIDSISEVLHLAHPSNPDGDVVGRAFSASEITRA